MRVLKYYVENKAAPFENKVNENDVLSYCEALRCETIKKVISFMSNLQTYYHFKLDFEKVDQHTGGEWLIHGTNRLNDNKLQSRELPLEYHSRECKHDTKESEGNMFNPIFKENVQGRKHPGSCAFAEPELLSYRKPKPVVNK